MSTPTSPKLNKYRRLLLGKENELDNLTFEYFKNPSHISLNAQERAKTELNLLKRYIREQEKKQSKPSS